MQLTTDNRTTDQFKDYVRYETRRQFLSRGSNAVSWAALASLHGARRPGLGMQACRRAKTRLADRRASTRRPAAVCTQGQAGDLSAHGRRTAADGYVRLQARDGSVVR